MKYVLFHTILLSVFLQRYISRVVDTQVEVVDGVSAEFVKVTFTAPVITASEDAHADLEDDAGNHRILKSFESSRKD